MKTTNTDCVLVSLVLLSLLAVCLAGPSIHPRPDWKSLGHKSKPQSLGTLNWTANLTRLNNGMPIISSSYPQGQSSSAFTYNYNGAVVGSHTNQGTVSLVVRTQNLTAPYGPYDVGPSRLAYVTGSYTQQGRYQFYPIQAGSIVFEGVGPEENYGVEDPRIVFRQKTQEWIMLYTAVEKFPNGTLSAKLSMAVTKNPRFFWERRGPLFPDIAWSKSGSLLLRDDVPGSPHFLIFGDSSLMPGIQMAISYDLVKWDILPGLFLEVRTDSWDSALVEAGPMPLQLITGDYLFIYNSARGGFPSKKPGYQFQYNVGWLVLDYKNPTKILHRSDEPILSPVLDWETGSGDNLALVPNVVFCEGWHYAGGLGGWRNAGAMILYYGGADSVMGSALLTIQKN